MVNRIYFGVLYWGFKGNWHCDLIPFEEFKRLKDLKVYIKDWKDCQPDK